MRTLLAIAGALLMALSGCGRPTPSPEIRADQQPGYLAAYPPYQVIPPGAVALHQGQIAVCQ
jgi:hypothetical protein